MGQLTLAIMNVEVTAAMRKTKFRLPQRCHAFGFRGRYLVDPRHLMESFRKLSRAKPVPTTSSEHWDDQYFEGKCEEIHVGIPGLDISDVARQGNGDTECRRS